MRVGMRERLRYWFDGTMSRGTPALIVLLGLASVVLIVLVTGLAVVLAPDDVDGRPLHVAWMSLLRTLDPGTMGADEGSYPFLVLMLAVTVGGIFIVSALVGVLATGLEARLQELRKGRSRVIERGHTVILGWSEEMFTILTELAKAGDDKPCAVVLADRDKAEMEDAIRGRLRHTRIRVVCRTGDPADAMDIELTRPDAASAIVIPEPDTPGADIQVIKTLLALSHRDWPATRPPIVAVIADSANMPAATLAGGEGVDLIDAEDLTARLVVQSRRQTGLSVVCTELLGFDGEEFYPHLDPDLVGLTYAEAQLRYDVATVVGLLHPDGRVSINPPPATVITADDTAILLASGRSAFQPPNATVVEVSDASERRDRPGSPEHTLVLGWNKRCPTIIRHLDGYVPNGSTLHVGAVDLDPLLLLPPAADLRNLAVTGTSIDPTQRPALDALDPARFDHVIVLADDRVSQSDADSRTLVTVLHLRDIKNRAGGDFAIVSELNDDNNRRLAQVTRVDDFIVGRRMINLILVQLAKCPDRKGILAELFDAHGADIYLEPAGHYAPLHVETTFAAIIRTTAARGETAIGLRLQADAGRSPTYGIQLNPGKTMRLTLVEGDRLIVLANR